LNEEQRKHLETALQGMAKELKQRETARKWKKGRKKGREKLAAIRAAKKGEEKKVSPEKEKEKKEGWSKEKQASIAEKRKRGLEKYKAEKVSSGKGEAPKVKKQEGGPKVSHAITKEEVEGLKKRGYTENDIKKLGEAGSKAAYHNNISVEDSGVREKGKSKASEISEKRKAGYSKWLEAKKKQKELVKKSIGSAGSRVNTIEERMLARIARSRGEEYRSKEEKLRPSERKMLANLKNILISAPKSEWSRKRKGKLETVHRKKNIILRRPKQGKIPEA
jgi:hypothetical protein